MKDANSTKWMSIQEGENLSLEDLMNAYESFVHLTMTGDRGRDETEID